MTQEGVAGKLGLEPHVFRIAIVMVIGAIMSILDTTIVNIALRTLAEDLDAPLDDIQWVATGYLLSLALVIPLTGWAAERYGARRVWLTSVALFTVGSALCGFAWDSISLIVFRVMQGFGGGMIMPVGMILLAQAAGPKRMGAVMSIVGVPMLLAPALGPALGGLIVDNVSWRWIFFVNIPIGIIGMFLGRRILPPAGENLGGRLDRTGLMLVSPGLAAIVFALAEVSSHGGIDAPTAWVPLVAGIGLVAAYVRHALRVERPLIDIRLFGHNAFASAAATNFLVGAALFGSLLVMPLYYQLARGESPLDAGLLLAPQGLGVALAMPFTGPLTDRIGGGRVALCGLIVLSVATIPFALVNGDTPLIWLELVLFIRGIGIGATMMPAMAAAYATLDGPDVPRATSALNVIQRVGGSIGTAVLAVVLQHQISEKVPGASGGGLEAAPATGVDPSSHAAALAEAFGATFWWSLALTLVAVIPTLVLVRATRKTATSAPPEAVEIAA